MTRNDLLDRIQQLEDKNRELVMENEKLTRFLEIGRLHRAERNIDKLLPLIMAETTKALDADRSTLFVLNLERQQLWTRFAEGLENTGMTIELKMGIAGLCVFTGIALNIKDAFEHSFFNPEIDGITGYRTQSILCAPIFDTSGEAMGVIQLLNKASGIFTKEDEMMTQEVSRQLGELARTGGLHKDSVETLVARLRQATASDRASVFLLDRLGKRLSTFVADGLGDADIHLNMNVGIAGYVAITGKELNVEDVEQEPLFDETRDNETGYRTKTILCLPIRNQTGGLLGAIEVINKRNGVFGDSDVELLRSLNHQIAVSLENAILFHEQEMQFESLLEVLAASIDAKDPMTAGHSEKVAEYAAGVAREMGFLEAEIDVLNVAALLHDYGKIGVSDSVLKKPGKLTDQELLEIKKHIDFTRSILSQMRLARKYRNVPHIASCHHERLDGSGYARGLRGHEIPVMSKILAVADVFEALTADRHYHRAMSPEEAFEVLERDVCVKFDENIVKAMKSYWSKRHGT